MRFLKSGLLVLLLIALPGAVAAQKAKTIDELARMFDSSRCKECHAQVYEQWEQSHHARPLMGVRGGLMLTPLAMPGATPFSPEDPKKATIDTFPCFKCHLPQAVNYAEDSVAVELAEALIAQDREKIGKLQITCIVCHNERAIVHRLQKGQPERDVIYGARDMANHPDEVFTSVKKSAIMQRSIMCGQCHGLGPNLEFENPVQCATIYGSYLHAYIPAGGTKTCQDCHMQQVDGVANHVMPPNWDNVEQTTSLLQETISLDVQTVGLDWLRQGGTWIPMLVVNTRVASNAGHRIPDG
jgi:nitrate/TMAO reductase-like tetraheme cytochrome c subunit